ncbi:MAG TPA: pyridoxal-phosphate dependent enzyme [Casimicrobiaceae bacterium]|nr:pyridoxal-phosphate dependent enzyme [Casimicrobiaceae bacterium]
MALVEAADALALPDLETIRSARSRIAPHVHRTPVLRCRSLDEETSAELHFKAENLQRTGAFKARGASNAVLSLSAAEARRGVVTHSSGNHGAALAYAAALRGIPAFVVMPENAARTKQDNVRRRGATIRFCAPTIEARDEVRIALQRETGATLIHPFDDPRVIAGQGTAALELLEDAPGLDAVVAPVGGGGLLSGTAIAVKSLAPAARVFGAEPANADDASRSFRTGRVEPLPAASTIADGLRTTLSPRTLGAIRAHADGIGLASEAGIVRAMRIIWERMKIVVEPSAALPLAAILEGALPVRGLRVGIVLSGGNVDLDRLPWQS